MLFALWRALPSFRGEASLRTFVYRVAHNRGISFRARTRPDAVPLEEAPPLAAGGAAADDTVVRDDDARRLLAAVQALPPLLRQVVVLQLEGLAPQEIAEVLGVSTNVVNVRAFRARQALRDRLVTRREDR